MIRVLIVDDHPSVRVGLYALLRSEPGFVPVGASATAEDAVAQVGARAPDVVLADYHLPDQTASCSDGSSSNCQTRPG